MIVFNLSACLSVLFRYVLFARHHIILYPNHAITQHSVGSCKTMPLERSKRRILQISRHSMQLIMPYA